MKKLIALLSFAAVFGSCEKEKLTVAQSSTSANNQTLPSLIQQGDVNAYDQFYNNSNGRAPKPSVKFIHGVFLFNPNDGPESGTCLPHPTCPCFTIITWPAYVEPDTPEELIASDYNAAFAEADEGELIINDNGTAITIDKIKSVNLVFDRHIQGQSKFSYTHY